MSGFSSTCLFTEHGSLYHSETWEVCAASACHTLLSKESFCQAYLFKSELNHHWPTNQGCMVGKKQSVILSWQARRGSDTKLTGYKDVHGLCWTHTGNCRGFDKLIFFVGMRLGVWNNRVMSDRHPEFKLTALMQKPDYLYLLDGLNQYIETMTFYTKLLCKLINLSRSFFWCWMISFGSLSWLHTIQFAWNNYVKVTLGGLWLVWLN